MQKTEILEAVIWVNKAKFNQFSSELKFAKIGSKKLRVAKEAKNLNKLMKTYKFVWLMKTK